MTQFDSKIKPEEPQPQPFEYDGTDQKEGLFQNYNEYSKSLRTWFVAYGIGGPVLFLSNEKIASHLTGTAEAVYIVSSFLIGVALQILLSMINKWVAWHMYAGAGDNEYKKSCRYKIWCEIGHLSWIDILFDVLSAVFFVIATWKTMMAFLAPNIASI
ncbi:hypothetical protein G3I15_35110 [Streptomyces sp. SID10244]|nr:hypothetical protein [Streptomyces sp. SID10244]